MGATRNPAEWLGVLEDLGTIEEGRLADLIIVSEDPLEDIRNIKGNVETVIIGGKVMDISFHADYSNPIPSYLLGQWYEETPKLDPLVSPRIAVEGGEAVTVTRGSTSVQIPRRTLRTSLFRPVS